MDFTILDFVGMVVFFICVGLLALLFRNHRKKMHEEELAEWNKKNKKKFKIYMELQRHLWEIEGESDVDFENKYKQRTSQVSQSKSEETPKPASGAIDGLIGIAIIAVVGFIAFKLIVGGFNYVSDMDFGDSENEAKIKQLENRIKQLESKSNKSKSILDAIKNLEMQLFLLDD